MAIAMIESLESLKRLGSRPEGVECFIMLNSGLRSSKFINMVGNSFYVFNDIDDSEQYLSEEEIMNEQFNLIGEAIKKGALFAY